MIANRIKKILRAILKTMIVIALIFGGLVFIRRTKPTYISTSDAFLNLHRDSNREVRKIREIYLYPRFNGTMMIRAMGKDGEIFRSNVFSMTALHGSRSLTGDIYSYGYPVTIKRMPVNVLVFLGAMAIQFSPMIIYLYFSGLRFRSILNPQFEIPVDSKFNFTKVIGQEHVKKIMLREIKYNIFKRKRNILAKQSGVLFYGPPGTGKTMFVRALAGTVQKDYLPCKLLSMSAGGISELYVGSGAKKIREIFKQAVEYASNGYFVIIFIDEAEAFGSRRNNQHSHSNNNISELLAQMDGVRDNRSIIIIFATNYKNKIDKALLRAGRIDLKIGFRNPRFSERVELIKSFLPSRHSIKTEEIKQFAKMTSRSTPAFIKSIFRIMEKQLLGKKPTNEVLLESWREVWLGPPLPQNQLDVNKEDMRRTAFHEAGHAFVLAVFSFNSKFFKEFHKTLSKDSTKVLEKITKSIGENVPDIYLATIEPRGNSGGMVIFTRKHDHHDGSAVNMVDIICSLAGNAAEKYLNGANVTSGCSSDFRAARSAIRKHFIYLLGQNDGESGALEDDLSALGEYDRQILSQKTGKAMQLLYDFTIKLLEDNWKIITKIAEELLKKDEIPGSRIYAILDSEKPTINLEKFKEINNFFLRVY
jgi:cell division protease FtsH